MCPPIGIIDIVSSPPATITSAPPVLIRSAASQDLSVTYDDRQGTELAINHLLAAGRKHIAYVGGPERHQATRTRREATDHALSAAGLTLRPTDVLIGEWSSPRGHEASTWMECFAPATK